MNKEFLIKIRIEEDAISFNKFLEHLKLADNNFCHCYIKTPKEILVSHLLDHKPIFPNILNGYAVVGAKWYGCGIIYLTFLAKEGDRGDEDGFGMEDDDILVAIIDAGGNYLLPFVDCRTREAQWKAFEYGISPVYYESSEEKEFQKQKNKK